MLILETFSVILAYLYLYCHYYKSRLCWVFWAISSLINIYLALKKFILLESLLSIIYFIIAIVGFISWSNSLPDDVLKNRDIKSLSYKEKAGFFISNFVGILTLYYIISFLKNNGYMQTRLIFIDSITTVSALFASYLTIYKYLDADYYWIFINIFEAILYYRTGLYQLSFLHVTYVIFGICTYLKWYSLYMYNIINNKKLSDLAAHKVK